MLRPHNNPRRPRRGEPDSERCTGPRKGVGHGEARQFAKRRAGCGKVRRPRRGALGCDEARRAAERQTSRSKQTPIARVCRNIKDRGERRSGLTITLAGREEASRTAERQTSCSKQTPIARVPEHKRPEQETLRPHNNPRRPRRGEPDSERCTGPRKGVGHGEARQFAKRRAGCGKVRRLRRGESGCDDASRAAERQTNRSKQTPIVRVCRNIKDRGGICSGLTITLRRVAERRAGLRKGAPGRGKADKPHKANADRPCAGT